MEQMKFLSIKLWCDFKWYTECLFDFGDNSELSMGKKHEIDGYTAGLRYAKIITEEQRNAILDEVRAIHSKWFERFVSGIAKVKKEETVKEIVAKVKVSIENILLEKEESK